MNVTQSPQMLERQKRTVLKRLSEGLDGVLVPFCIGAGQVAEDAADSHPQGEDRLADVGSMVSRCSTIGASVIFVFLCLYVIKLEYKNMNELLTR